MAGTFAGRAVGAADDVRPPAPPAAVPIWMGEGDDDGFGPAGYSGPAVKRDGFDGAGRLLLPDGHCILKLVPPGAQIVHGTDWRGVGRWMGNKGPRTLVSYANADGENQPLLLFDADLLLESDVSADRIAEQTPPLHEGDGIRRFDNAGDRDDPDGADLPAAFLEDIRPAMDVIRDALAHRDDPFHRGRQLLFGPTGMSARIVRGRDGAGRLLIHVGAGGGRHAGAGLAVPLAEADNHPYEPWLESVRTDYWMAEPGECGRTADMLRDAVRRHIMGDVADRRP